MTECRVQIYNKSPRRPLLASHPHLLLSSCGASPNHSQTSQGLLSPHSSSSGVTLSENPVFSTVIFHSHSSRVTPSIDQSDWVIIEVLEQKAAGPCCVGNHPSDAVLCVGGCLRGEEEQPAQKSTWVLRAITFQPLAQPISTTRLVCINWIPEASVFPPSSNQSPDSPEAHYFSYTLHVKALDLPSSLPPSSFPPSLLSFPSSSLNPNLVAGAGVGE